MASQEALADAEAVKLRKGPWLMREDLRLTAYVTLLGERRWDHIAKVSGLKRTGKSCRLRWLNYLRPDLKHGEMTTEEEETILQLHRQWGNRWSKIAQKLPGRTDNEIKNYWRSYLRRNAQEQQENLKPIGSADQNIFIHEMDTLAIRFRHEDCRCVENKSGYNDNAIDVMTGLSSFIFPSSPYEDRVLDWLSNQTGTEEHNGDTVDFTYSNKCFDDGDACVSHSSGSIWDCN